MKNYTFADSVTAVPHLS